MAEFFYGSSGSRKCVGLRIYPIFLFGLRIFCCLLRTLDRFILLLGCEAYESNKKFDAVFAVFIVLRYMSYARRHSLGYLTLYPDNMKCEAALTEEFSRVDYCKSSYTNYATNFVLKPWPVSYTIADSCIQSHNGICPCMYVYVIEYVHFCVPTNSDIIILKTILLLVSKSD